MPFILLSSPPRDYRNCAYPQHLTLQLSLPARLQQVQLLSHEYKIAGKIEIQILSSSTQDFSRLGYLSFDSNERTQFSARELKSVSLPDVETAAIRLIIHRCHTNHLNVHSQASLIMLNIVGETIQAAAASDAPLKRPVPVVAAPPTSLTNPTTTTTIPTSTTTRTTSFSSEGREEGVDDHTAQRIFDLQAQKAAAVEVEDYDEAKRLKGAIDRLRAAGVKMAALEARKKAAVDEEDYDTAKVLKIELERMRERAYASASAASVRGDSMIGSPSVSHTSSNAAQQQQQQQQGSRRSSAAVAAAGAAANGNGLFVPPSSDTHPAPEQQMLSTPYVGGGGVQGDGNDEYDGGPDSGGSGTDWHSYDERPARAKGAYDLENIGQVDASSTPPGLPAKGGSSSLSSSVPPPPPPLRRIDDNATTTTTNMQIQAKDSSNAPHAADENNNNMKFDGPPPPPGFPQDLPYPEPLSTNDAKESGPLQSVVGEFITRCLYSKAWQLREAAMSALATNLLVETDSGKSTITTTTTTIVLSGFDGSGDALRLLCGVVAQGLKARIPAVAGAALQLLRSLVASATVHSIPPRDLHAALSELLPAVAERAADGAPRARDQAVEAILDIARIKESGMKGMTGIFLKSFKRGESPKTIAGRLQLVAALLPVLGVSSASAAGGDNGGGGGFSAEAVMHFLAPALTSATAEVRSSASSLVVTIGKTYGVGAGAVLPLLPADVNPKLRIQIEAELTGQTLLKKEQRHSSSNSSTLLVPGAATSSRRPSNATATTASDLLPPPPPPSSTSQPARQRTTSSHGRPPSSTTTAAAVEQQQRHRSSSSSSSHQQQPVQPPPQQQQPQQRPSQNHREEAIERTPNMPPPPLPLPPHHHHHPSLYAEDTSYAPSSIGGADLSVADEDPAPFEEELRRREASLGPTHTAVAEAATNLAIIYNQRGEGARALPLYQRALHIWEATYGPHHPDVAHVLTDIAVILLEAGHDAEGRNLLRRAMDIQLVVLGPDHPDVVAIRDVLEEDP